ncbi:MAG: HIT domain-containing protein, partial [Proteobacteria bacterium]
MQGSESGFDDKGCPFCNLHGRKIVGESESAIAFYDGFPISKGHTLVVSRRHVASYFELETEEKEELWQLADEAREMLQKAHSPDGFN